MFKPNDVMVGLFFRPSSREFHTLIADGIQDFDGTHIRAYILWSFSL